LSSTHEASSSYIELVEHSLKPMHSVEPLKINPPAWNWENIMETRTIYIDDICSGTPLTPNRALPHGLMVDWKVFDEWFELNRLYWITRSSTL